jgi:hypothetical protein
VTKSLWGLPLLYVANVHQVYDSEYGPGEVLHVDVDLTRVNTLVRVWVHPSKQLNLQVCHKKYKKQFTCTLVEHIAVIPGISPNLWLSAAPQECYVWGCSESNAPYFFLRNYLFRMYEIHAQYNCMFPLHMLFFHIISIYIYGLRPARNKGMHAFPVAARFLFT